MGSEDVLRNKLQDELGVPFRDDDESGRDCQRAETEYVQAITVV